MSPIFRQYSGNAIDVSFAGTLAVLLNRKSDTALDSKLLEILVCPVSKAPLVWQRERGELWCRASGLAYPVEDGFPVMVAERARELTADEIQELRDRNK